MNRHFSVIRQTIGWLIIALPVATVLFGLIGLKTNPTDWWCSISATYYTNSNAVMVGIIAICAYFFITYQGYSWQDKAVNITSGACLFLILIFPCYSEDAGRTGLFLLPAHVSDIIHSIFALLAFLMFFLNVRFLFTKSDGNPTEQKKKRNVLYKVCADLIPCAALPCIIIAYILKQMYFILIGEIIALWACGLAWLVKGYAFAGLRDV